MVTLSVDQVVRLRVLLSGREVLCQAHVQEVSGDTFKISHPERHSVKLPVTSDRVQLLWIEEDALYEFDCPVATKDETGLTLSLPGEHNRIQRREYVRVPLALPCEVEVAYGEPADPLPPAPGRIINLSGGGCALSFVMAVDPGTRLTLSTQLPEESPIKVPGEVRRVTAAYSQQGPEYQLGVQFLGLDEGLRGQIVRCVFTAQRLRIRDSLRSR